MGFRAGVAGVVWFGVLASGCGSVRPATPAERGPDGSAPLIELRLVHDDPVEGTLEVEHGGETLYVEREPLLSDADFQAVRPSVRDGELFLDMEVNAESAERLVAATGANIGRRMALLLESRIAAAPVIRSPIGARGQAAIRLPPGEAERVAERIRTRWPEPETEPGPDGYR